MQYPRRVAIIGTDYPVYEQYCPNWVGMQQGLEILHVPHRLFSCRPALDIAALAEYAPDLVVYGLIDMAKRPAWRQEIRERLPEAKIVMWYGDYRDMSTGQSPADMSEMDALFISNDAQSDYYKKKWSAKDVVYLPLGSPLYNTPYDPRHDFDFVFIGGKITGSSFLERAMTIGRYQEKGGLRVIDGEVGRPWLRAKVFRSMPSIYKSSKVVLDQSHFTNVQGYTSNRFWIITGAGGFALTKRWPGCEESYPEGTRAYFDSEEECLDKMHYYLAHPREREVIRLAGHQHAANHTYDHRFIKMFEHLYG